MYCCPKNLYPSDPKCGCCRVYAPDADEAVWSTVVTVLRSVDLDAGDLRPRRALAQECEDGLDLVVVALGVNLDPPVFPIPDPAHHAELSGEPHGRVTKEDALDPAGYNRANRLHRRHAIRKAADRLGRDEGGDLQRGGVRGRRPPGP